LFEGILGIKKPIFGLDIGYQTMKLVQIKGHGKNARLLGAIEVPIMAGVLSKDGVREKQKLAQTIRQAMNTARPHAIAARIVSSALPESLVFTKSIDLPKMSLKEINKNIPYRATEFFPIPPEETFMDWQVVGQDDDKTEVLVVATPKVLVNALSEVMSSAALELMGLETKPVSITRALIDPQDKNTYLVIDIGAKTTGLTCYDQQTIKLTSTIAIGGDKLQSDFAGGVKALSQEIIHLIKYYQNRIGQAQIFHKIILAGGGANISKIPEAIEGLIKIKTEIGQPQMNIKSYDPRFATAIGLAMRDI